MPPNPNRRHKAAAAVAPNVVGPSAGTTKPSERPGHAHPFMPHANKPAQARRIQGYLRTHVVRVVETAITIAIAALFLIAVVVLPTVMIPSAGLSNDQRLNLEAGARTTLIQAAGGLALLIGAMYTARTYRMSTDRNMTDRFAKAVEQLGSPELHVRVGAIYSLGRIASDSRRDYLPVLALITAFIKNTRTRSTQSQAPIARDIQAALEVLAARRHRELESDVLRLDQVDLSGARLNGVDLSYTDLTYARLHNVWMVGCKLDHSYFQFSDVSDSGLSDSDMSYSSFGEAILAGTYFPNVNLSGSNLAGADLTGADLAARWDHGKMRMKSASVQGANLAGAIFDGAALEGVDLSRSKGLIAHQLHGARINDQTILPPNIRRSDIK